MKKIIALVLCRVMALSLCAVANAAVPAWVSGNGGKNVVDVYDMDNIKLGTATTQFFTAKDVVLNSNGTVKTSGQIAYATYTSAAASITNVATYTNYVVSDKYSTKAVAAIKANNSAVATGAQGTPVAIYYLIPVSAVEYNYTGAIFTAWGTGCGQYKAPTDAATAKYYAFTNSAKTTYVAKEGGTVASETSVLVDGFVVNVDTANEVKAEQHAWIANSYAKVDGKQVTATYKCSKCGVVGTVVASPFDPAAAGHKVEKLAEKEFVYFDYAAGTAFNADGSVVTSAKTFDAGVAMYVGMSIMAATGSAVVIGKKKEF